MSIREKIQAFPTPISSYIGTAYYAKDPQYGSKSDAGAKNRYTVQAEAPRIEKSLKLSLFRSLLPIERYYQPLLAREKPMLECRDLLQPDAEFPTRNMHFLTESRILPAHLIAFFAENPIPHGYHPYQKSSNSAVDDYLKRVTAHFETLSIHLSFEEKLCLADKIAIEIRHAHLIHFADTQCKDLSEEDRYIAVDEVMRESDARDSVDHSLYELGARYHLTCSLMQSHAFFPMSNLKDISNIYNFMTVTNTFIPSNECLRFMMQERFIPSIAQTVAHLWHPKRSLNENLHEAQELIRICIDNFKETINKGCIDSYVEEEDRAFIADAQEHSGWNEPDVENEDIDNLLAGVESELRKAFARKLVSSLAASYKAAYTSNGALPQEITQAIEEINLFANASRENSSVAQTTAPYNPARDLISNIFDHPSHIPTHLQQLKKQAHPTSTFKGLIDIFYRFLFPASYARHLALIQANRERSLSWAEKQWDSVHTVDLSRSV